MESLRDVRAARGLTLADVGALAGVDAATVSRIERRRAKPKPETIVGLARALGISVERALSMAAGESEHKAAS